MGDFPNERDFPYTGFDLVFHSLLISNPLSFGSNIGGQRHDYYRHITRHST